MTQLKAIIVGLYAGGVAVIVGLIVFTLSWNLWDVLGGPMPGYQFFLYPGNLTLVHVWHPLFTEELAYWRKLGLLMLGQFTVVAAVVGVLTALVRKVVFVCRHSAVGEN